VVERGGVYTFSGIVVIGEVTLWGTFKKEVRHVGHHLDKTAQAIS